MANAVPGVSTLKARVGWIVGSSDTVPTSGTVTWFTRVNETGEIALTTNTIDASALEDDVDKMIAGRGSTGGTYTITFNQTPETVEEMRAVMVASAQNNGVWVQEWVPGTPDVADWIFCQFPAKIPKPGMAQNSLRTVAIECAIVNFETAAASLDTEQFQ